MKFYPLVVGSLLAVLVMNAQADSSSITEQSNDQCIASCLKDAGSTVSQGVDQATAAVKNRTTKGQRGTASDSLSAIKGNDHPTQDATNSESYQTCYKKCLAVTGVHKSTTIARQVNQNQQEKAKES